MPLCSVADERAGIVTTWPAIDRSDFRERYEYRSVAGSVTMRREGRAACAVTHALQWLFTLAGAHDQRRRADSPRDLRNWRGPPGIRSLNTLEPRHA